jgi:membrane fusion protein, multidrug efflux system
VPVTGLLHTLVGIMNKGSSMKLSVPRKLVFPVVIVLSVVSAALWAERGSSQAATASAPTPPSIPVQTSVATMRDVAHTVSNVGTVQALQTVTLRPQIAGVLSAVLFSEGQLVGRDALLARIDDRALAAALAQARAERGRNDAQLRIAQLDLGRYENLLAQDAIARQSVEQQRAQVEQIRAALVANDASIAAAEVQLSYTRVTSPLTGRVGMRHVDAGNYVSPDTASGIVTVSQLDPISIVFTLPQERLSELRDLVGRAGAAPVVAMERGGGRELGRGRMVALDNQVDTNTGSVRLRAEFPNPRGELWPGQFVTVQLRLGETPSAVVVPPQALRNGLSGPYVFRVRDGKADLALVKLAYQDAQTVAVTDGLTEGDVVVIDGQSRLKPGVPVRVETRDGSARPAVLAAQSAPVQGASK